MEGLRAGRGVIRGIREVGWPEWGRVVGEAKAGSMVYASGVVEDVEGLFLKGYGTCARGQGAPLSVWKRFGERVQIRNDVRVEIAGGGGVCMICKGGFIT